MKCPGPVRNAALIFTRFSSTFILTPSRFILTPSTFIITPCTAVPIFTSATLAVITALAVIVFNLAQTARLEAVVVHIRWVFITLSVICPISAVFALVGTLGIVWARREESLV